MLVYQRVANRKIEDSHYSYLDGKMIINHRFFFGYGFFLKTNPSMGFWLDNLWLIVISDGCVTNNSNLVGGLEHFLFFHFIYGIILSIDFHIFQDGENHQPVMEESLFVLHVIGMILVFTHCLQDHPLEEGSIEVDDLPKQW